MITHTILRMYVCMVGPIEVDLDVERTSVTGSITCHDTSLASLSCELRRKNGKIVETVPCM